MAPARVIPSTSINANSTDGEPSRKRLAKMTASFQLRTATWGSSLFHLNPSCEKKKIIRKRRKLNFALADPTRSAGFAVLVDLQTMYLPFRVITRNFVQVD